MDDDATRQKKRLDTVLAERYPDISRSTWQKHIKAGRIKVDDVVQTSPRHEVTPDNTLDVDLPQQIDFSKSTLPIIYLDDNVIVVNKPAGVLTHSKGVLNDEFTVAEFFRRYTTFGLTTNRPGIVHRLDRDTSGVMIGARHQEAATLLQKQFSLRRTHKTYIAIVEGHIAQPKATIELPLGRNPSLPSSFRVDPGGKPATTHYEVIASRDNYSLVKLQPITGRTHQLRVHMQYLKAPILGDRVYGQSADRLYLHAYSLEITIPKGQRKIFTAPLPAEFRVLFPEVTL